MQEATTQILLYRLLFPVIASPPIAQMAQCVMKGVRLHGLDLSTKHVADDSHKPEVDENIWNTRECIKIT
ncbi:hypothetical protein CC357_02295 [Salmonella enterica subsp. enterica serovar Brandenburg]|nr:hypothetical protein [Salmonella enterica subsp. enterica serovar Brandenburg]EBW5386143.1 hypothetical protein [Salmonella enterica subsp. enterica serovar Brandenburg]EBW7886204.1 hypothetical protein [Salmonella enterica subsp. enterica serovar Brandenburg]ECL0904139.1 hypothetical protein [Salmonella enterica subsp. enterica serovar Brandenburg]ECO2156291.1 hypothetical protein [Salmonella enterica subsp. enterica serovar Brandenburg]